LAQLLCFIMERGSDNGNPLFGCHPEPPIGIIVYVNPHFTVTSVFKWGIPILKRGCLHAQFKMGNPHFKMVTTFWVGSQSRDRSPHERPLTPKIKFRWAFFRDWYDNEETGGRDCSSKEEETSDDNGQHYSTINSLHARRKIITLLLWGGLLSFLIVVVRCHHCQAPLHASRLTGWGGGGGVQWMGRHNN
jgi:hypothetical protein